MNDSADYENKTQRVREIFTGIAGEYDRVNTVISLGQIGRWRRKLVETMDLSEKDKVLDLGCGTGQLTRLIAESVPKGEIVGVDLTPEMIEEARRALSERFSSAVNFQTGKGESLDLDTGYFDTATSAFTLRNVEDVRQVLSEMQRVVKPGGKVFTLELAKPSIPLFSNLYFFYFNNILPLLGGLVYGETGPYRYLTESLRKFPNQERLKDIYIDIGLEEVTYEELFGGIAAIHSGRKRENR
jgi:demethylmenaquinone methyltransferase/2-methoxy-6-polyprenyl-1,4-benzoquinol methylase